MKKRILNISTIAFVITTIGYIMDGDVVKPTMLMRFVEFIFMFLVMSILTSIIYFGINFAKRSFQKA
jgi:hypothetical protein